MKTISCVLGPLPVDRMGTTLAHEHICCGDWSMRVNFGPRFCPEENLLARAVEQVNRAKAAGVATIVDGTAINLGRDIHLLRQVSRLTGVNLVASSGFYDQDEPWLAGQEEGFLFDLLDHECKHGIAGTDSRPGLMKCAVGTHGLTPTREKILRLTARVAVENDLPVFCHHEVSTRLGPQILDLLCGEGLAPKRIILGHAGDSEDLDYILSLLDRGCWIGQDRWPYDGRFNTVASRVETMVQLRQRGLLDRVLFSHDLCVYLGFWESMEASFARETLYEGADFTYLFRTVFPKLQAAGFPQEELDRLMTENPRNFFAG